MWILWGFKTLKSISLLEPRNIEVKLKTKAIIFYVTLQFTHLSDHITFKR
jgi:hypothetical protein